MDKNYTKRVRYEFIFRSSEDFQYEVDIDPTTLEHPAPLSAAPEWANLEVDKCPPLPSKSGKNRALPLGSSHCAYFKLQRPPRV